MGCGPAALTQQKAVAAAGHLVVGVEMMTLVIVVNFVVVLVGLVVEVVVVNCAAAKFARASMPARAEDEIRIFAISWK